MDSDILSEGIWSEWEGGIKAQEGGVEIAPLTLLDQPHSKGNAKPR